MEEITIKLDDLSQAELLIQAIEDGKKINGPKTQSDYDLLKNRIILQIPFNNRLFKSK